MNVEMDEDEVLDRILALRPSNAAQRLGPESLLPVLNPRDLARALDQAAVPLVCVPVPALEALPGILRAARDEDAVLGLACPHRPADRDFPAMFFDAVVDAAEEFRHVRPVFLQAGPLRITSADPKGVAQGKDALYRYVDAGFSLISIDASELRPEAGALVISELIEIAAERELSVEIAAPVDRSGHVGVAYLRSCLEGLKAKGADIRFVSVRSAQFQPRSFRGAAASVDAGSLKRIDDVLRGHGAWLAVQDAQPGSLGAWAAAGVRKLDVGGPFAEVAMAALDARVRDQVRTKAYAARIPIWELLAQLGDPLAGAPKGARLKVEAHSYSEASVALDEAGAKGSATAAMTALAQASGY